MFALFAEMALTVLSTGMCLANLAVNEADLSSGFNYTDLCVSVRDICLITRDVNFWCVKYTQELGSIENVTLN